MSKRYKVQVMISLPTLCEVEATYDEEEGIGHAHKVHVLEAPKVSVRDVYTRMERNAFDNAVIGAWSEDQPEEE